MDQPTKKHKVSNNNAIYREEVLFNSDTLSKIISYLPSVNVLNLAITCKRFGISDVDEQSIIKKSAYILVQDTATEEQLAALPHYEGESSLADYHYLQLLREPLVFDQLVGGEFVNDSDKSCVRHTGTYGTYTWTTALSNNILRAGKHYVSFIPHRDNTHLMVGVMRPGRASERARGYPSRSEFFQHFSRRLGRGKCMNKNYDIHSCMYMATGGSCYTSNWKPGIDIPHDWVGKESASSGDEIGMLLDLDEGTLSVYKNRRNLGVMKSGLAGQYCWVVSMWGSRVTIKRGTIPPG